MAFLKRQYIGNSELFFWQLDEPEAFFVEALELTALQVAKFRQDYRHQSVWQHWLASRYALLQLLGWADYRLLKRDKHGKLHLKDKPVYLSVSHSADRVVVAKSPKPVGIDIQQLSPKLRRIASKYVPAPLLSQLAQSVDYELLLHLHWSAKEALFKAYGKGQLDFKKHLFVPFFPFKNPPKSIFCRIKKADFEAKYSLNYEKMEDYIVCFVTKQPISII